jgi:hypothetical protein
MSDRIHAVVLQGGLQVHDCRIQWHSVYPNDNNYKESMIPVLVSRT